MVSVLPEDNKKIADDKKTVPNHTKDYRERERERDDRKVGEMRQKQGINKWR